MSRRRKRTQRRREHHGSHPNARNDRGTTNAKLHAKARAAERYGLDLTNADLLTMARSIRQGDSRFITKQPLGREIHVLTHQGVKLAVLYDPKNHVVLSTLPSDHRELTKRRINLVDPRLAPLAQLAGLEPE